MGLIDETNFLARWPLPRVLWNRIRYPVFSARAVPVKIRQLETERLLLREFCQEDIHAVAAWEVSHDGQPQTEIHAQKFLDFCFYEYAKGGMGPWAILLRANGHLVGNCGFPHMNYGQKIGEINYFVARQYRGRGFATEALTALLKFGFEALQLSRIQGRCLPENTSSERVMRKAGMEFEKMIRPTPSQGNAACKDHDYEKLFVITPKAFAGRAR